MPDLNIRILVDVLLLLSGRSPASSVFLFDDAPIRGEGWGRADLRSPAAPGTLVRWTLTAIDLQTPVWLRAIDFAQTDVAAEVEAPMWARAFQGRMPTDAAIGTDHPYRLILGFGREAGRRLIVDGPSLVCRATS